MEVLILRFLRVFWTILARCCMWTRFALTLLRVVVWVPGDLNLDLANALMGVLVPTAPHDNNLNPESLHGAMLVWTFLLLLQLRFWGWLLVVPPKAISEMIFRLILLLRSALFWLCMPEARRQSSLANRLMPHLIAQMDTRGDDSEEMGAWLFCTASLLHFMDIVVVIIEWEEVAEYFPVRVAGSLPLLPVLLLSLHGMTYSHNLLLIMRGRPPDKEPLWHLSPVPVHTASPSMDCRIHDTCRICLENLCTSAVPREPSTGYMPPESSLSVVRRRRRCASPGISAARTRPPVTDCNAGALQGACTLDTQIATLRCGHSFHLECIKPWRKKRAKAWCPTCRTYLQNQNENEEQKDQVTDRELELFGSGVLTMCFMLVLWLFSWTLAASVASSRRAGVLVRVQPPRGV